MNYTTMEREILSICDTGEIYIIVVGSYPAIRSTDKTREKKQKQEEIK